MQAAKDAYRRYKSDREPIIQRIRDNEKFYRSYYARFANNIREEMDCKTPLIFSCIENAAADISANYPVPNVLERDPEGTEAAEVLSRCSMRTAHSILMRNPETERYFRKVLTEPML